MLGRCRPPTTMTSAVMASPISASADRARPVGQARSTSTIAIAVGPATRSTTMIDASGRAAPRRLGRRPSEAATDAIRSIDAVTSSADGSRHELGRDRDRPAGVSDVASTGSLDQVEQEAREQAEDDDQHDQRRERQRPRSASCRSGGARGPAGSRTSSPKTTRWNIHSRYAAPRIITNVAIAATPRADVERADERPGTRRRSRQAGQPDRGEHEEAEHRGVDRHPRRRARPSSRSSGRGSARRSRRRAGTARR